MVHRPVPLVAGRHPVRRRCPTFQVQAILATPPQTTSNAGPAALPFNAQRVLQQFSSTSDIKERVKLLIAAARNLAPLNAADKVATNRVMGCTSQVWVTVNLSDEGRLVIGGGSDSELSAGVVGVMAQALSGLTPQELLQVDHASFLKSLRLPEAMIAGGAAMASRVNAAGNVMETIKRRTAALVKQYPKFPSLLIKKDALEPQGAFAEAQAQYLQPDTTQVDDLVHLLSTKKIGVVAHFYMDPQVQGVLTSAGERWPHVAISDSLVMADTAVGMAKAGCKAICVLGVDFMSENVRAILDEAGYREVQVYRMSASAIGCSLAEAAESQQYMTYLQEAGSTPNSMHVVYINTSLYTKAAADECVPTITCTSSNVVQTVLQGFAQVPDATVWYGPDTYMGRNLAQLFTMLADLPDEEVRALHPDHTAASIRALLPRLKYYDNGTCIVHHIFGGEVTEIVREAYGDAFLTAHFEVPGEMFTLAMSARRRDMGVVGSTSNILDFITAKVSAALSQPYADRLQFVLGTESGMITSIVRKVQSMISKANRSDVEVEIVFPVNPRAITTAKQTTTASAPATLPTGLSVLPGPALGEGCSLEGGCASCPYMRMNTLSALRSICERVGEPAGEAMLTAFKPKPYAEPMASGKTVAQAGCVPILHMRHFQKSKRLSDDLINDITTRHASKA